LFNITTKMLASTVKFSRNGRASGSPPTGGDSRRSALKELLGATDPSGLNSVLGPNTCSTFPLRSSRFGCTG
jgi:hypothetical protein